MKNFLLVCLFLLLSATGFSQALNGSISPSSPAICSGAAVVLTANGTGGTPGYSYFWITTGESTQSITITTPRIYTVRITDQAGATRDINIDMPASVTPEPPTASNTSGAVCFNSSARLEATAPAGAVFNWYANSQGGTSLGTGAVFNTPPITSQSAVYYVEATLNGCVSARTGVAAPLVPSPLPVAATVCENTAAVLTVSGAVDYRWWTAQTGGTQVGSGSTFTTPILTQTTTYWVEGITANGCTTERVGVDATVTPAPPAPTVASTTYNICINTRATLVVTGPAGMLFDWFDVPTGGTPLITSQDYTTAVLTADKSYWVQARLNGCIGPRTQVNVVVSTIPPAPLAASDGPACVGSGATLRVTNPTAGMTYQWYASSSPSAAALGSGVVFTTPALAGPTTYYVRAISGPCTSDAAPVDATVLPAIERPTVTGVTLICSRGSTLLSISQPNSNFNYEWFDSETGLTPLYTGVDFVTPSVSVNTTFYVHAKSGNCTSARTAVAITLLPLPSPPTVAPVAAICYNTSATLAADNGSSYRWYTTQTGGTPISSDRVFTTGPLTATTTFYVANRIDGCEGDRTPITVQVNPFLAPPTVDNPGPAVCPNSSVTLHAHAPAGALQWFLTPTGGNQVFQGPDYTVNATVTRTYYVQVVNGNCISDRTAVTLNVVPITFIQFAYSAGTYCPSSPNPTPIKYVAGGTFTGTAGLVIDPNTGTINTALTVPGKHIVYYTANNNGCTVSTSADINITNTADAEFSYNATSFCQGGANPRPNYTFTSSAGVFTANLPGIVLNSGTGEINLATSAPGTYIITNTVDLNPSCNSMDQETFTVTIQASVVPDAGADRYAPKENFTLSGSAPGATTVTWTTTNGQGFFTNPNSLNGAVYTPHPSDNAVTFVLSANDGGPCGNQFARVTITFINRPAAPATTTDTVCVGSAATLTAFTAGVTSYKWYDQAVGGTELFEGANYTTGALSPAGTKSFWVEALINGINGARSKVDVKIEVPPGLPQVTGDLVICSGSLSNLVATSTNAITYRWFNADKFPVAVGNTLNVPVFTNTSYFVQGEANDCVSPMYEVKVTVKATPEVVSVATGEICSGDALNYLIKSDLTGTTFTWTRAANAAINNNQPGSGSGANITEVLVNSTPNVQTVTYLITPTSTNGCSGAAFSYTVTVNPTPVLTSATPITVCNENPAYYTPVFNPGVTTFSWSRAAVQGISNASVSDQASPFIREALNNTTNAPVTAIYRFTVTTAAGCSNVIDLPVTVNPSVHITSDDFNYYCANVPFTYQITSDVPGATFNWVRNAIGENPMSSATGVTSINETVINNTGQQMYVYYLVTPFYGNCPGKPFSYLAIFKPQPAKPLLNANNQICEGSTLVLQTDGVPGATYVWTLPDGTTASTQTPVYNINNVTMAHAGTYLLNVVVNGCSSEAGTNVIVVNMKPTANAGTDQTVCPTDTEVNLNGDAHGGPSGQTIAGVWTTAGTGTFSAIGDLHGKYFPSAQDKANGSITLTLTSASPDDCTPAVDQVLITFGLIKVADAGQDQTVCAREENVAVSGTIQPGKGNPKWTSMGTGSFVTDDQLNVIYHPSAADYAEGFVRLVLTASAPGSCDDPQDEVLITFAPEIIVAADASPIRYVFKGEAITLHPTVSDENVTYQWSPATGLSDPTVKNPVVTGGDADITYELVVTNAQGCVSEAASVLVKASPRLSAANTFTPNADGVNDVWVINGIEAYPNAVINIYNRLGTLVYRSTGYPKPWDGTSGGKPVPFGVYYYVIDARILDQKLSGYVTVVR